MLDYYGSPPTISQLLLRSIILHKKKQQQIKQKLTESHLGFPKIAFDKKCDILGSLRISMHFHLHYSGFIILALCTKFGANVELRQEVIRLTGT